MVRRAAVNYVLAIVLLVAYLGAQSAVVGLETKWIAALIDPFGLRPFEVATAYWTVAEQNSELIWLNGYMLANRLLWTTLALGFVGVAIWRFQSFSVGTADPSEDPGHEEGDVLPAKARGDLPTNLEAKQASAP